MRQRQGTSLMLLLLYSALIVALLVLVLAGAKLYGAAVDAQSLRSGQRSALSFIQSQAAAVSGGASLAEGPEGTMLRLAETQSGYETRIFQSGGVLRADFCPTDAPVDPDAGEGICPLTQLQMEWESANLLRITADGESAYVCCIGGGDNG